MDYNIRENVRGVGTHTREEGVAGGGAPGHTALESNESVCCAEPAWGKKHTGLVCGVWLERVWSSDENCRGERRVPLSSDAVH